MEINRVLGCGLDPSDSIQGSEMDPCAHDTTAQVP